VVSEGAPAYALSFAAGRKIEAPATTVIADGIACRIPDEEPLEIIRENVDQIVQVSDDEIRKAMKVLFSDTHNIAEGAGAAALAAAIKEKDFVRGKQVALILSGGNVDSAVFANVLLENV
jgi:threonine dehydratase